MAIVKLNQLDEFAKDVLAALKRRPSDFRSSAEGRTSARGALNHAFLIFLNGHLGAGKTTFMQAFAKALGITEQIQSPTFVLMKKYLLKMNFRDTACPSSDFLELVNLVHIDAYRFEEPKEFAALKPEEFLNNPENIVCIEWAENIASVLPKPDLVLNFSSEGMGEGERSIEIEK